MKSFVNPFNFIPFGSKAPSQKTVETGTYSGVIRYTLLTKTPLVIPNTSNDDAFRMGVEDHKSYDFFSYNDLSNVSESVEDKFFEPVIPGSEMRGMIRSNYEIITNSCLSAVDDDEVLSKHTNETFKPGLLKKIDENSYELYKAEDFLLRTGGENNLTPDASSWKKGEYNTIYGRRCYIQDKLKEGQKITFEFRPNGFGKKIITKIDAKGCSEEGYVIKGEAGPEMKNKDTSIPQKNNKHCCHVIKLDGNNRVKKLNEADMASLTIVLKAYKENKESPYEEYSDNLKAFMRGGIGSYFPVYYSSASAKNAYIMLSPACITREIYHVRIKDMLGGHRTCNDKNNLCPACALFGTIGKDSKKKVFQVSSRLRFSDLYLGSEDKKRFEADRKTVYEKKLTLRPLGNPRLNNMEFYLKQPDDAWFWTYDYYVDSDGRVHYETGELNGRKFYWHDLVPDMTDQKASKLNTTVRPVSKDISFNGSVYFDKITKTELDELIYTLESGDKEGIQEKKHGYKLGHAKPLGFGSIAIVIDSVVITGFELDDENKSIRMTEVPYDKYSEPKFDSDIKRNYEKMTNFEAVSGKNVSYPIPQKPAEDGSEPIFKWFVDNHVGYDHRRNREVSMPNSRTQMVYREHMVAMNPVLQSTGYREARQRDYNNNERNGDTGRNNRQNITHGDLEYIIDQEYSAKVTRLVENRAYIELQGGGRASLYFKDIPGAQYGHIGDVLPTGANINITYKGKKEGKDGKVHNEWKNIRIIP